MLEGNAIGTELLNLLNQCEFAQSFDNVAEMALYFSVNAVDGKVKLLKCLHDILVRHDHFNVGLEEELLVARNILVNLNSVVLDDLLVTRRNLRLVNSAHTERLFQLEYEEYYIGDIYPAGTIRVVRYPNFEQLVEMVTLDRIGVLLVGAAEAFEDDGDEQVDHHDAHHEDESDEIHEAEPGAALGRPIRLVVLEGLLLEAE